MRLFPSSLFVQSVNKNETVIILCSTYTHVLKKSNHQFAFFLLLFVNCNIILIIIISNRNDFILFYLTLLHFDVGIKKHL
jgi:hypothetical protein